MRVKSFLTVEGPVKDGAQVLDEAVMDAHEQCEGESRLLIC